MDLSGISPDSRELLSSDRAEAREAIYVFTFRIAGEVARLATTLGGLNAIVFTAGIGEHQPQIRAAVCERLAWLGVGIDAAANARNDEKISTASSRVADCKIQATGYCPGGAVEQGQVFRPPVRFMHRLAMIERPTTPGRGH